MESDDNRGNEAVAKVSKLISNDNNKSFKLPYAIFLRHKIYDDIDKTRQERERLVLDLYFIRERLIVK